MEEWKPLEVYKHYSVSNQGRVRSDRSNAVLAIGLTPQNRPFVKLTHQGQQISRGLALLVAEAFLPIFDRRFNTPIHLNGDLRDCRSNNLLWRPRWFAQKHTLQFSKDLPNDVKRVRNITTGIEYDSIWDVVIEYGVLYMDVFLSIYNKTFVFPTWHYFEWVDPD